VGGFGDVLVVIVAFNLARFGGVMVMLDALGRLDGCSASVCISGGLDDLFSSGRLAGRLNLVLPLIGSR
jgi:hypothetical protein